MDQSQIKIRRAEAGDVSTILGFIRALAEYEKLTHLVTATEAQLAEHLFGSHPVAEVLIGLLHEKAVGFALFFNSFSTFLGKPGIYLEDLFVLPEARSHGVGKALIKAVGQLVVDRNYGRLEWAVLDWNDPAIGFYKKLGAISMDEWTTMRVSGDGLFKLLES